MKTLDKNVDQLITKLSILYNHVTNSSASLSQLKTLDSGCYYDVLYRGLSINDSKLAEIMNVNKINLGKSYSFEYEVAERFSTPDFTKENIKLIIELKDAHGIDIRGLYEDYCDKYSEIKSSTDEHFKNTIEYLLDEINKQIENEEEVVIFDEEIKIISITKNYGNCYNVLASCL